MAGWKIAARMAATALLVGLTSVGLVTSTAQTAQADVVYGNAERAAVKLLTQSFMKGGGARAAAPGVMEAMSTRCVATGPVLAGCVVGAAALTAGVYMLGETSDYWVPWLLDKIPGVDDNPSGGPITKQCASTLWGTNTDKLPGASYTVAGWPGISISPQSGGYQNFCYTNFDVEWEVVSTLGVVKKGGFSGSTNQGATARTSYNVSTGFQCQANWMTAHGYGGCPPTASNTDTVTYWAVTFNGYQDTQGNHTGEGFGPGRRFKPGADWGETTSRTQCKRPDGSQYEVNRSSLPVNGSVLVARCDPGDEVVGLGVKPKDGAETTIDLKPTPSDATKYPACVGASCLYRIFIDGQACEAGTYDCVHWSHISRDAPSRVECLYGPYRLPIEYCNFLERAYSLDVAPRTITKQNTDGNPDTWDPPAPVPEWQPQPQPTNPPTSNPTVTVTDSPSPTQSTTSVPAPGPTPGTPGQPSPEQCKSLYPLGQVKAVTIAGVNKLGPMFNIKTVGGYRETDPYPDHPSGLAADFMLSGTATEMGVQGMTLAEYAKNNAAALHVDYIMWDHMIWSVARASEMWRDVEDRGSPTANHEDHVHITFKDDGSVPCSADPGAPPTKDACWPNGWGVFNPAGWVLQPMKCAFIPQQSKVDAVRGRVTTAVLNTGVPDIVTAVRVPLTNIPDGGSSCRGPALTFPKLLTDQGFPATAMYPVNACAEPLKTAALVTRYLSMIVIVVGGGLTWLRLVGSGFGFNVAFKGGQ